ncbi:MAG: hypothetical protein GF330_04880 [Candidatus Eisenbacteria bacterium]|nr:hypothetical protein [Candidatus Eisenbacteria bacterium]
MIRDSAGRGAVRCQRPERCIRLRSGARLLGMLVLGALATAVPIAPQQCPPRGASAALAAATAAASDSIAPEEAPYQRLDLHYFHPTLRCVSCVSLEAYCAQAVRDSFAAEVHRGALRWHAHDFEHIANAALVDSFGIEGSTLIIAESLGGQPTRFEPIGHIWHLLEAPDSLRAYVASVIRAYQGDVP